MRGRSRSYSGVARYRRVPAGHREYRDLELPREKELEDGAEQEGPCIWIGACPEDVSEREVNRACSKFGMVHGISIRRNDRETFALVRYGRVSHARDAIYGLDQTAPFRAGLVVNVEPAASRHREADYRSRHSKYEQSERFPRRDDGHRGKGQRGDSDCDRREPRTQYEQRGHYEQRGQYRKGDGRKGDDRKGDYRNGDYRNGDYRNGDYRKGDFRKGKGDSGHKGDGGRKGDGGHRRSRERQSPPRQYAPRPVRVYLSQLPRDMEEDEFQEIVAEYGEILQYELHREGAYKCGWVEYASKGEAEAALGELDDRRMDDWTMRLQAYMYPGGGP